VAEAGEPIGRLEGGCVGDDAACTKAADTPEKDPTLEALPFEPAAARSERLLKWQARATARTRIATRWFISEAAMATGWPARKIPSLHPMKIVKQGMPSLTGQFEISSLKMENDRL